MSKNIFDNLLEVILYLVKGCFARSKNIFDTLVEGIRYLVK